MKPQPELEVVSVPTDELTEYRNNCKMHPSSQVEQIVSSIEEFGFVSPVLAWHNDDGVPEIVAGHGRLLAARRLGMAELPVVFLDHLTDEQRRALTLADNQLTMNSGFDFQLLNDELDAILDIDMRDFGFDFFEPEDAYPDVEIPEDGPSGQPSERRPRTVTCPCCGEEFEV